MAHSAVVAAVCSHRDLTERCAQKKAHAALPPQEIPLPGKQKHVFGGTFAVLHSLSQAGPQTCPEALQEEPGAPLALSTECDFLQRNRQQAELKNGALLQVRGWTRVGSERTGQERSGNPLKSPELAGQPIE